MAKHLAQVDILGSSFTIKSDESTEHLAEIIEHFSSRIAEARRAMPQADSLRVAIVSGLNIADELFKARKENAETVRDAHAAGEIASRLIGMIDQTLVARGDGGVSASGETEAASGETGPSAETGPAETAEESIDS